MRMGKKCVGRDQMGMPYSLQKQTKKNDRKMIDLSGVSGPEKSSENVEM